MKMSDWFVVLSQKQDSQTGFWRTPCGIAPRYFVEK